MAAAIAWNNHFSMAYAIRAAFVSNSSLVSAVAFDATYPAENAYTIDPSKFARVNYARNATGGGYVLAQWQFSPAAASDKPVRVVGMLNCRIPTDATQVLIRGYSSAGSAVVTGTYNPADLVPLPGTTDRYNLFGITTGAAVNVANVGLVVFVPPSTGGYIDGGTVWASDALILDGTEEGWNIQPVDGSDVERTKGGGLLSDEFAVRDVFRAGIPAISDAQARGSAAAPTAPSIKRLQKEAGKHAPVVLLPNTSSAFELQSMGIYCSLRSVPTLRRAVTGGPLLFDSDVDGEEIR